MLVKELMSTYALVSVGPRDSVELATEIMRWADVVHLPVTAERGAVVGVVSARDLLGAAPADLVDTVMSSPAITVSPEDHLADAATTMVAQRIGCLPVVDGGQLVGMLTPSDLVAHQVARTLHPGVYPTPTVEALLGKPLVTVAAGDALLEALARMTSRGVRHLPVVDGDGRLVGIVSDRDVRAAVGSPMVALERGAARARVRALKVADVMSRDVATVPPTATLAEVTRLLAERRVGAVPVVDVDHRLVGLLSYVDVLRAALEG